MQQITIRLTDEQRAVLDTICDPVVTARVPTVGQEPDRVIVAYEIFDDKSVKAFVIAPDGTYTYDVLNDLGRGWTRFNSDCREIDAEDQLVADGQVDDRIEQL